MIYADAAKELKELLSGHGGQMPSRTQEAIERAIDAMDTMDRLYEAFEWERRIWDWKREEAGR